MEGFQKDVGISESSSGVYSHPENGRDRSASGGSTGTVSGNPLRHSPLQLEQLLNHLPHEVRKTTWEIRNEIAKRLNKLKNPIGNDWRLVASRLGFTAESIDDLSKTENPTLEMLQLCDTKSTEELFRIIQSINRSDVIEDLLSYLVHNSGSNHHCQESFDDEQSLTQPLEESCSDISKLSKQPSEQEDDEDERKDHFSQFLHSQESQEFWEKIPGPYAQKKWRDFSAAMTMNNAYPEESNHGEIDKFLCHILKIDYDERQDGVVRLDFFFRLLAFFGPLKLGGCLTKMYGLIVKSVTKSMDKKKHSWFAGYMNKEETENRLSNQSPGTFIIRFSGSKVEDGWFVLAVSTREGVKQIEIEKDTANNELLLAGESFPDLPTLVDKLRREVILKECRQLLTNPCLDLPLNSNFIGYTKATRNRGRGRGRGRPQ